MPGEKNLEILLRNMRPALQEGEYVFCTLQEMPASALSRCVMTFQEAEGITVIANRELADEYGWKYQYIAGWITLKVHSSLEAVGLTAAVSHALAKENISCNVVAAYYHDHIFVDRNDCEKAMEVLESVTRL